MKHAVLVCLSVCVLAGAVPVAAQENFTEGPISRVTLLRVTPGHGTEFWQDIRQNLKPIYEEYKKQGVVQDYSFFTKATLENPDDWNVGISLTYQNYAALEGLAAKTDPITLKFYGSRDRRTDVARRRPEHATTVASFLIRTVEPRAWAAAGSTPPKP